MNHAYNLLDENVRGFNAAVPMYAQWDDHDVTDNWYWEMRKDADPRYGEGSVALLAARAMRAFHDYLPTRLHPLEQDRIFSNFAYGPSLEVFRIDLRSYRGPNGDGLQTELSPEARIIGQRQLAWLMQALQTSRATWKVIACDMPIGLVVWDDFRARKGVEAVAQGDMGPPMGRELEFAELFRFIRDQNVTERRLADGRRALHRRSPLRPEPGAISGVRAVLGVRLRAAQCRHVRPESCSTPRSGRRWCSRRRRRLASLTCRPRPGCSSSDRSTSTAPAR